MPADLPSPELIAARLRKTRMMRIATGMLCIAAVVVLVLPLPIPFPLRLAVAFTDLIAAAVVYLAYRQQASR